jgi:signal transduction histidine kinase
MISQLRPDVQFPLPEQTTIKESGSVDTLYAYTINWSRQNQLPVNISISAEVVLAPALQIELLRVAQEALSNITRHSDATQVSFALTGEQGQVVLIIRDNGCGFDSSSSMHAGVGLHAMRERMEELGGSCEVVSQVKQGTCVTARVPSQVSVLQSSPERQEREKKR